MEIQINNYTKSVFLSAMLFTYIKSIKPIIIPTYIFFISNLVIMAYYYNFIQYIFIKNAIIASLLFFVLTHKDIYVLDNLYLEGFVIYGLIYYALLYFLIHH
jgi:hypothetical protein